MNAACDGITAQPRHGAEIEFPASFAQERLWFFSELDPASPYYNQTLGVRVEGRLDIAALQRAVGAIVARHEVLRTTFVQRDGRLWQRVARQDAQPSLVVDLTGLLDAQRERCRRRVVAAVHERPFDLAHGPLLRRVVVRLAAERWYLGFVAHHVITDFSGLVVFLGELAELYAAAAEHRDARLPPLAIQYGDFALWHREWMRGPVFEAQLDYWTRQLAGAQPLQLPTDLDRPPKPSFAGALHRWSLPAGAVAALRTIAREEGATLFMALLALFKALLAAETSQIDVSVGVPVANRPRPETHPLIGFFANTLVLRTSAAGNPSFRELLRRVRQVCLDAYRHQDLPFERLVETLHPERKSGRNPLFEAMFRLESHLERFPQVAGLTFSRVWDDEETVRAARFDLEVAVKESPAGLSASIEYNTDLFAAASMHRLAERFDLLLEAAAADPDRALCEIPMAGAEERRRIAAWHDGPALPTPAGCIHELIAATAAAHPHRTAVRFADQCLTYRTLDERTNQLARHLRQLGVGPESRVAVCAERSVDMVVALLGVLKSGGAYVPLDPEYPRDRLSYMLGDARASIVLTHAPARHLVADGPSRVVDLDADRPLIEAAAATPPQAGVSADNLMYVIYTSGSTGRPKGAMNAHRAVVNRLAWMQDALQLEADDRILQKTPFSFDVSVWEFFWPLIEGCELVVAPPGSHRDPSELIDAITGTAVTTLHFVPSMLAMFLSDPNVARCTSLRRIVCSGEALPRETVDRCLRLLPWVELYNLYGPTEAAVDVSWWRCASGRRVAIGRPIANVSTYVLSPQMRVLPVGAAGELCIGGVGVGRGYLGRPALTAEKFVPDPCGAPGGRMYRTGDLTRWAHDGEVEYLGRIDRQVKVRGLRIELGEVEAALAQHASVSGSAALVHARDEGDSRIVAFVVPQRDYFASYTETQDERVSDWRSVWTQTYEEEPAAGDPTFNTTGWRDSVTGAAFGDADMREWVDATVTRILSLAPRRLLEVGCGAGLLLARIAPRCDEYVGTDFTRAALDYVRERLLPRLPAGRVSLLEAAAVDLKSVVSGPFDTIVLNSVVQYFPSLEYLQRVIDALLPLVERGTLFIGDVRNLVLLRAQHAAKVLAAAPPTLGTVALAERCGMAIEAEDELVVHPAFFAALCERHSSITAVEVLPKRGRRSTEMNRYRYDVVVHVGDAAPLRQFDQVIAWSPAIASPEALDEVLVSTTASAILITGIPNARVTRESEAARLLERERAFGTAAEVRWNIDASPLPGLDPEDVCEAGERRGLATSLSWLSARPDGAFDAAFIRPAGAGQVTRDARLSFPSVDRPPRELATIPTRQRALQRLVADLRTRLVATVPPYLIPAHIVPLPALPVTPNGKLDQQALARIAAQIAGRGIPRSRPQNTVEELLAETWAEILHVEHVGVDDDFFDLGGHSLLATQLAGRIRRAFSIELPLQAIFQARTVRALARTVAAAAQASPTPDLPLTPRRRRGEAPLSHAQQRLFFLDHVLPDRSVYNMAGGVRVSGSLSVPALRHALATVLERHEVLRSRLVMRLGEAPVQIVEPVAEAPVWVWDLSGIAAAPAFVQQIAAREARRPFDLAAAPLLRVRLVRLGPSEHVLLVTMHHIVSDGWSLGIFISELMKTYAAARAGATADLPALPIQYGDFAVWERERLTPELRAREAEYWRRQLATLPELHLVRKGPRPALGTHRGGRVRLEIPAVLAGRLRELTRQHGVTLFMTLVTALYAALTRQTGQRDLAIVTDVANRQRPELEALIGFFVNQVVLRAPVSPQDTWRDLLDRVRETTLAAYAHQDLPFDDVVREVALDRDLSRAPLAQVKLVLQNAPTARLDLPEAVVEPFEHGVVTVKVDVQIMVERDAGDGLTADFEYNVDLFESATIERLAADWLSMLQAMAAAPDGVIDVGPPVRETRVLAARSAPSAEGGSWQPVFDAVSAHAAARPNAVAVACGEERITYRELEVRTNRLAHYLRRRRVGPEVRVALCLQRGVDLVTAIVAVLKAGGAYVPLDPEYPAARVNLVAADAGAALVLTHDAARGALGSWRGEHIDLDRDRDAIAACPSLPPALDLHADNLAYVIYTSGSTGRPKGVAVTHGNLARLLSSAQPLFRFDERDVWTLFHSYAFDFSVWELWGALAFGGRLVVVPTQVARDAGAFHDLLVAARVTVLNQTPSAFQKLLDADEHRPGADLPVRYVIFGGEALNPAVLRRWFERHPAAAAVNMYGITETTVHVTFRRLTAADLDAGSVVGEPLPDLGCFLGDATLVPVGPGAPGELYVSGAGLARGYLGRPGLTASRYLPHPNPATPGERVYRSGDIARRRENGELQYVGRRDHQVKIRGFRVELGEIEHALLANPEVRAARVVLSGDGANHRLTAYVISAAGARIDRGAIVQRVATVLPAHMVPSAVVPVDAFPLTPEGKLDPAALPPPAAADHPLAAEFVPARTAAEQTLAAIWSDVLGVPRVGIDDDYFALGGDSMLSLQLRNRAAAAGVPFAVADLFTDRTIRRIAARTSPPSGTDDAPDAFALLAPSDRQRMPADAEDAFPLSYLQTGMLFESERRPDSLLYRDLFSHHLHVHVDLAWLRGSLDRVVARHPALRTSFHLAGYSEPLQIVHTRSRSPVDLIDLSEVPAGAQARAIRQWLQMEKTRPFRAGAPPLRITVHQRAADELQFTITFHHALLDGWSVATFVTEVFEDYCSALTRTRRPTAVALPAAFRTFVRAERYAVRSAESRAFWEERLRDAPATAILPWPQPVSPGPGDFERVVDVPIETTLSLDLRATARALAVPLKSLLLAAHAYVLGVLSSSPAVQTGVLINGRPAVSEAERALGLFLNNVPFRVDLREPTWAALIRRVAETEQELQDHRLFPLAEIQALAGDVVPYHTTFNFVHFHPYDRVLDRVRVLGGLMFEQTEYPFSANFAIDPVADRLRLTLKYQADSFSIEQVQRIGEYYARTLRAIAQDAQARLADHVVLSVDERATLVQRWNVTQPLPPWQPITDSIAQHAVTAARRTAVQFGDVAMSYAELNDRANRLAHYLCSVGVGREVRVGLCLPRTADAIVAIVATLQAGGVYVPLDPSHPSERLGALIDDAGVAVIVTDRHARGALPVHWACEVDLDRDAAAIAAAPKGPPPMPIVPQQLAYVIYTSGSTGRPKGVAIPHRQLTASTAARLVAYTDPVDRFLLIPPLAFDSSVATIFWTLMAGATLVIAPEPERGNPSALARACGRHQITHLLCVPSLYEAILHDASVEELASLRVVIVAGEICPAPLVVHHHRRAAHACLFNEYGPTEGTVWVTVHACDAATTAADRVPIGRPIPGACVYIGAAGAPAPVGVGGELMIGGAGVARGYLERPGATAERFVPDPFSTAPGARLYRTGDRARWLPNGDIDFLGRGDRQVKINGYRVELAEVEAAIRQHASVPDCAVLCCGEPPRLVAYVEADPAGLPGIREDLQRRLPVFMVPTQWVALECIPRSTNGKADYRALAALKGDGADEPEGEAPRTITERVIAAIWSQVLQTPSPSRAADFFSLGGHSLAAIRVVARLRDVFDPDLPLQALFDAPVLRDLAAYVDARQRDRLLTTAPPLTRAARTGPLPLSFAQQRLWVLATMNPDSVAYNCPGAVRLRGPLDFAAVRAALRALVDRHELLRTVFIAVDGRAGQVVQPALEVSLPCIDISDPPPAAREHVALRIVQSEASRPFDVACGPLFRAWLVRLDAADHLLLVDMHHIISDGWSVDLLLREFRELYDACACAREAALKPLAIQYADYAVWQRRWLDSGSAATHQEYWRSKAPSLVLPPLPTDYPRLGRAEHPVGRVPVVVGEEAARALRDVAERESATLFVATLAAFHVALARVMNVPAVSTGSPLANRSRTQLQDVVGPLVTYLVTKSDFADGPTFADLVRALRRDVVDAYVRQDLPFEEVLRLSGAPRTPGISPLYQAWFVLHQDVTPPMRAANGVTIEPVPLPLQPSRLDVVLELTEGPSGLHGALTFAADLYSPETARRIVEEFVTTAGEGPRAADEPALAPAGAAVARAVLYP